MICINNKLQWLDNFSNYYLITFNQWPSSRVMFSFVLVIRVEEPSCCLVYDKQETNLFRKYARRSLCASNVATGWSCKTCVWGHQARSK